MSPSTRRDVLRFHNWSRTYERSLGQVFLFDPVHRKVVGLVAARLNGNAPRAVLDIGCGTGRLLRRVSQHWPDAKLFGVDPAEGMLDNARRLTPTATFLAGQGESLPVAD